MQNVAWQKILFFLGDIVLVRKPFPRKLPSSLSSPNRRNMSFVPLQWNCCFSQKMFEKHLLARVLFLVDLTEMIVTAFDNYYSNVFQGFFWRQKTGQFCCVWQSEKDPSFSHDMTNIPFISTHGSFNSLKITRNDLSKVVLYPIIEPYF